MGDISEHFSQEEFTCKCGCGKDDIDYDLVYALETLRSLLSKKYDIDTPITIISGCRCPTHNATIDRASSDSEHIYNHAADVSFPEWVDIREAREMAECIYPFQIGGIGLYENSMHLDIRQDGPTRWVEL